MKQIENRDPAELLPPTLPEPNEERHLQNVRNWLSDCVLESAQV